MNICISNQSNSFNQEHNGTLAVQTYTAKRAYPVPRAEVTIFQNTPEGEKEIFRGQTDISGKLFSIPLPGVKAVDTLNPKIVFQDMIKAYSYTITVTHPDYVTTIFYNAPVFEGILSIQSTDLVPKVLAKDPTQPTKIHQKRPRI